MPSNQAADSHQKRNAHVDKADELRVLHPSLEVYASVQLYSFTQVEGLQTSYPAQPLQIMNCSCGTPGISLNPTLVASKNANKPRNESKSERRDTVTPTVSN